MFYRCIVLSIFVVFSAGSAVAQTHVQHQPAPLPHQQKDITPEKMEALLAASAELDAFFAAHHRKLERARPDELTPLQKALITKPKAILARHNLTSDDLAQWRKKLEAYGDIPEEDMEDPHYSHVIKRLMPRQR